MERVVAYIDGFNLYFGLKSKGWKKYYWLNVQQLAQSLLKPHQTLAYTKYFTARVTNPPDKVQRQATFLQALETLPSHTFTLFYGRYQHSQARCSNCGYIHTVYHEKMTDVNIAVEMVKDAFQNTFDTAFLISADADLSAPIEMIKQVFPHKRIICAFPPGRNSVALQNIVHGYFTIGEARLRQSRFPPTIQGRSGLLQCPVRWK